MKNLDRCVAMARDGSSTYAIANGITRRMMNQAMWKKLYVTDEGVIGAELAEPYVALLSVDIIEEKRVDVADDREPVRGDHDGAEWRDCVPAWLVEGSWWNRVKTTKPRTCARGSSRSRLLARAVSLGLGSKETHLVRPPGLEPGTCRLRV